MGASTSPALYTSCSTPGGEAVCEQRQLGSAASSCAVKGSRFTINGQPDHACAASTTDMIFPLNRLRPHGLLNEWLRVLNIAKSIRHEPLPFPHLLPARMRRSLAADVLGIYMEPELPVLGHDTPRRARRASTKAEQNFLIEPRRSSMLDAFGSHPSYCHVVAGQRALGQPGTAGKDPAALQGKGQPPSVHPGLQQFPAFSADGADDYYVGVRLSKERLLRGSFGMCDAPLGHVQTERPSTMHQYDDVIFPKQTEGEGASDTEEIEIQYGTGVKKVQVSKTAGGLIPTKPVVTHEIGQYEVYPDFREIDKYTGPLKARNFEIFRFRLGAKGMLRQADKFFRCSGALAAACYKEEIEAAMRSQYIAGFQLLDLQDFSGQGTALVGMLDAFMDSKGLISPEEWRMFCSDCVLLAQFPSYVLITGEMFVAKVSMRTVLPQSGTAEWMLVRENGDTLGKGTFPVQAESGLTEIGSIFCRMPEELQRPERVHLILSLTDTDVCNAYDLMLYPAIAMPELESRAELCITENLDTALAALADGKKTVFLPRETAESIPGFYCTDFWCYPMFRDICNWMKKPVAVGTMGLCIQDDHPALAEFPTQEYSTPQWYDIVTAADCTILDDTPSEFTPIVQMIDNFERNHKLGIVWEAKVGSGSLLVCTSRLSEIATRPEVRWLAKSLLDYAASDRFAPAQSVTAQQLQKWFRKGE